MNVYLSHTDDLEAFVSGLAADLQQAGIPATRRHTAEPHSPEATKRMLRAADALVFVIGVDRGVEIEREWSIAVEESWARPDKRLIPIVLASVATPAFLQDRQAIRIEHPESDRPRVSPVLVAALRDNALAGQRVEAAREQLQQDRLETLKQQSSALEPGRDNLLRQAEVLKKVLADPEVRTNVEVAEAAKTLADVMKRLQQPEDALRYQEVALAAIQAQGNTIDTARMHTNIASTLRSLGRKVEAIEHFESAIAMFRAAEGPDTMNVAMAETALSTLFDELGRADDAAAHRKLAGLAFKNAFVNFVRRLPIIGDLIKKIADGSLKANAVAAISPTAAPARPVPHTARPDKPIRKTATKTTKRLPIKKLEAAKAHIRPARKRTRKRAANARGRRR